MSYPPNKRKKKLLTDCRVAPHDLDSALYKALFQMQVAELSSLLAICVQRLCQLHGLSMTGRKAVLFDCIISDACIERDNIFDDPLLHTDGIIFASQA